MPDISGTESRHWLDSGPARSLQARPSTWSSGQHDCATPAGTSPATGPPSPITD